MIEKMVHCDNCGFDCSQAYIEKEYGDFCSESCAKSFVIQESDK